ncbi:MULTISPECIES: cytochrome P450 [Pantoea]|jgi:cytochrome P450|uniref:Cytochrome P450 n=1 Tax=Pantoea eucalypti TaxID=470933 RepID=A0ABY2ZNM5_9GAMM|nr:MULTISPECIES: cytochrome P450 [Pantoea]MCD2358811.1 cytochrome P450 [Pantoea sp. MHSD4]PQL26467.1 cytochrome P450 [Pantoea ananatis]QGF29387.1 cytochrome P450 [Pantoea eucalypti]TPV37958.1 cytochrome P450 [Pantoea eucalypti]
MQLQELMNPDYSDNPFPLYRKLHQQGPLIPAGDKIIISGSHAVVEALLNDRRVGKNYMESVRLRFGHDAADMPLFQGISRMFLVLNPPEHSRLKGLVMKSFSAREIKPLREMALTVANELVDALADRRACDLAQAFAFPLPVRIICRMLDISESDAPELGRLTSVLVKVFDPQISQADLLEAADAFAVLERYFSALIVSRRDSTANDLVSLFLRSGSEDDRLSHDEIIANVVLLFLAGHETTSNMICNTILALHDHPQELACLKRNPALIPNAIEECLRYDSSVQMLYRTTLEEIELAGQLIPTGTRFFLSLGAANHDPRVFTSPERVNIRRHEGRCLAFGGGIHHCMGYRLALAEMEVALHVLLTRLPELRPITAGVRRNHRANLRGVNALPVEW